MFDLEWANRVHLRFQGGTALPVRAKFFCRPASAEIAEKCRADCIVRLSPSMADGESVGERDNQQEARRDDLHSETCAANSHSSGAGKR